MKKRYFISMGVVMIMAICAGLLINGKLNKSLSDQEKDEDMTQRHEEEAVWDALLAEEWVIFTDTQGHYTYMHPKSLGAKTSSVASDGDDSYKSGTTIIGSFFTIGYYYPTEEVIEKDTRFDEKNPDTKVGPNNLDKFVALIRQELMLSASTSPDKLDQPLKKVIVDGLPAYQFEIMNGVEVTEQTRALGLQEPESFAGTVKYRLVILEDPHGQKLYIRYVPENPVSERIFKSFMFTKK